MKKNFKQFIVRKYVLALSASQAIRLEKKTPVDDVFIDDDWKKNQKENTSEVGFKNKKQ